MRGRERPGSFADGCLAGDIDVQDLEGRLRLSGDQVGPGGFRFRDIAAREDDVSAGRSETAGDLEANAGVGAGDEVGRTGCHR